MSKSTSFQQAILDLIFLNTNIANIGDATGLRGSTVVGSLHLALHSADPGEAGTQSTNEISAPGYARKAVPRDGTGWVRSGNSISPFANQDFPAITSGSGTYQFWSVGTLASGAGVILYKGVIGSNLGSFSALATDVITIAAISGVAVNDNIAFFATPGDVLPAGVVEGTVYFVKTLTGNDITIAATSGGATIDITGAGKGRAMKVTPKAFTAGDIPRIPTSSTITED